MKCLVLMWLVLHLNKPRQSLRGYCRRFLLEPSSNFFVGKGNRKLFDDLDKRIKESGINAIIVAGHSRSDLGMVIRTYGESPRQVINLDGFQAIVRKTNR
jgi:hypothetical protein